MSSLLSVSNCCVVSRKRVKHSKREGYSRSITAAARKGGIAIALMKNMDLGRVADGAAFLNSSSVLIALMVVRTGQSTEAIVRIDLGL